jgi:hypothetical protein
LFLDRRPGSALPEIRTADLPTVRICRLPPPLRCHVAADFDEVTDVDFSPEQLEAIHADRCILRFHPLLSLAKLLVRGRVPDRPGGVARLSLMFDMNAVVEA